MMSQKTSFALLHFEYYISVEHDENLHSPILVEIGSWGSEIWLHEYLISPNLISRLAWFQTVMKQANLHCFQWGYLGIHAFTSQATINQSMQNLMCEHFSSCSTDIYGHENAAMQKQKFD